MFFVHKAIEMLSNKTNMFFVTEMRQKTHFLSICAYAVILPMSNDCIILKYFQNKFSVILGYNPFFSGTVFAF